MRHTLRLAFAPALALAAVLAGCGSDPPMPPPPPPPPLLSAAPTTSSAPVTSSAPPDATPQPAPQTTGAVSASTPTNDLTLKLYAALATTRGNLFFSGASVRSALSLAALGARGATLDELARAINVDADPAKNAANAKAERDAWSQAAGKSELVIANRLWVDKSFALDGAFTQAAQTGYGAAPAPVDFVNAAEPSRQTINAWVATTTKNKIRDLLPGGSITGATRLVITNAIYFKGTWATAFPKTSTADAPFHGDGGAGAATVKMMHLSDTIAYAETNDARAAELPYKDSDLGLMVVLPKDAGQLASLESSLAGAKVDAWAKLLAPTKLDLAMPRFKIEWGHSLSGALQAMGVRAAFTDNADFSGISAPKQAPLEISDVVHKAFVQVDETGTEAAAATGVVMQARALVRRVDLTLDRPFLIFLRNRKTGDVLFAGRVVSPG